MKRALVTGAAGFAGQWLCRLLEARGYSVIAWTRPEGTALGPGEWARVEAVDLTDEPACRAAMDRACPDLVFHLGAITHTGDADRDPTLARRVNVDGTRNVVAAAPASTVLVLASTCHVYGPPLTVPVRLDHPCHPRGTYAETKLAAEVVARAHRPDVRIVRAFHHLGPGQPPRFALSDWARQLRESAPAICTGDLSLRRDFTDVRDIVEGYLSVAEHSSPAPVVHLCSGRAPTLGGLLAALNGGTMPTVRIDPARLRAADPPILLGDPSSAAALGWTARRSVEETLRLMGQGRA